MNNPTNVQQEQLKGRRYNSAVAFAFGFGAAFGAAISYWITRILVH
jgi:hypothetical protein